MVYADLKQRTYLLLDPYQGGRTGRVIDLAIIALILLSVVAVILQTVDPIAEAYAPIFTRFEQFAVAVFTIEYLGRIWSITTSKKYRDPVTGRFRYALTPYLIIDLLAILPFYIGGIVDLRFIRILRLFRVFRLLKTARYSNSIQTIGAVIRSKRADLVVSVVATLILLVLTTSLTYFAERSAQPDAFSSIPDTFWWGIVTLSTVGYGDVVPVTPLGQFLAAISALLGVGLFALPASILASGFIDEATDDDTTEWEHCPHCGEEL